MVALIVGLAFGGLPAYGSEITLLAFMVAMTLSFEQVELRGFPIKKEGRNFLVAFLVNYSFMSLATLYIGLMFPQYLWPGFVVMASVPPAVAVVAVTRIMGGNVRFSFFSIFMLYICSLALTPLIILVLAGEGIDIMEIVRTVVLFIMAPLVLSRVVKRMAPPVKVTNPIIKISYFIIIFSSVGGNKQFLFAEWRLLVALCIALFMHTFGLGLFVKFAADSADIPKNDQIPLLLMAGTKNNAYAIILALAVFPAVAAIPAAVALIFEMLWIVALESGMVIKGGVKRGSITPQ
jgi:BASS family bile acid:Na+ symporter